MKTIPQPVETNTCKRVKKAGAKANAEIKNVESQHQRKTTKTHCIISKEQLQTTDIILLKNYSQFFIGLS